MSQGQFGGWSGSVRWVGGALAVVAVAWVGCDRWPGFEICLFGHIGDGNLHVNVMKPDALSNIGASLK